MFNIELPKKSSVKRDFELQTFAKYPNVLNYGQFFKVCEKIRIPALN